MEAAANLSCRRLSFSTPILHHNRLAFSTPMPSISYRPSPPPSLALKSPSMSVQASSSSLNHENPKPQNPISPSIIKSAFVATATVIAAATVFFARFNLKYAVAAPFSQVETAEKEEVSEEDEEREMAIEEHLNANPNDVQALRDLVETKVKNKKIEEAIVIVKRLIEMQPGEQEWIMLKAQLHCYNEEFELAEKEFNEIVSKDPIQAEAFHGLVMIASQLESGDKLNEIEQRAMKAMEICKKENKNEELVDFKLLIAQIRVIGGDYDGALNLYEEISKDDPRDFRPYLCRGIIFTLLRKNDEAEKQFEKYRRLVPQGHPYTEYFDNNMMATKLFAQKVENEVRRS
ncbi:protein SLOW GREEN 1, chloroplastic-like [Impatiens glandulifera]|uniref:protein SLOW GREEN 1, chloroplastic-like n=1 Tax=Impatiens glandulifera TaxID=253017 RepID=UPI001FB0CD5E|nr:protein SLOW GREEN 1, chloroplastic-like [Impatiens glandulifera]